MFRISYLVTDANLADAVRLATPLAINLNVSSVANGHATDVLALPAPAKSRGAAALDRLMQTLDQHNLKSFKASMFREILKEAGFNPVSYGYYLQQLIDYGCLSKLGKGKHLTYQVVLLPASGAPA
jgi:hypothetical protein